MSDGLHLVDLLIVDAEEAERNALERFIRRKAFIVFGASSSSEALALIGNGLQPKVMFLMADGKCVELIERLRQLRQLGGVPVYTMSGTDERLPSASGHFEKPFDVDAMLEVLKTHCR